MDHAPLTLAHEHARKASQEKLSTSLATAGNEHDLAADQYAKAAEGTGDIEALRILSLLEDHHHRLARIIKTKDEASERLKAAGNTTDEAADSVSSPPRATSSTTSQIKHPSSEKRATLSHLKSPRARESSPALAKDIASRRGIPQPQPRGGSGASPSVSTLEAVGRMSSASRGNPKEARITDQAAKSRTSTHQSSSNTITESPISAADDGFAKFYSNLTSGPLSRLSSMLAFAGLPLAEQSPEDSPTHSKTIEKSTAKVPSGPDVDQLFSSAALRALEDQHRREGLQAPTFSTAPGESFYVIPTSGGTASYANILTRAQQEAFLAKHPLPPFNDAGGSDEFVDAREAIPHTSTATASHTHPGNTHIGLREEELQIENAALKQILDKLSHRLQAFESHAQDASMAALTQSMASVRGPSIPHHATNRQTHVNSGETNGLSSETEQKMRAMQTQLEREAKERQRLDVENQRQKAVIAKYRSHWEQLKDSARARRGREGSGNAAVGGGG